MAVTSREKQEFNACETEKYIVIMMNTTFKQVICVFIEYTGMFFFDVQYGVI